MFEELRAKLAGVVAITVTPFTSDDRIDRQALSNITAHMADAGIQAVTPNGNTSEYHSLAPAERLECLQVVSEASRDMAVVAGVGGPIETAIKEARLAAEHGAEAVMVHQPVHPYMTSDGWVDYHQRIGKAVPNLGLIPYLKTNTVTATTITRLAESAPNFVAIKYALPDPAGFASIKVESNAPSVVWIAGLAESYAPSLFAYGARGFTSGLADIAPKISLDFHQALAHGDYTAATQQWGVIRAFEELRARNNSALNVSAVKEALHQAGLCNRRVRPPISTLAETDRAAVAKMIESWSTAEIRG